MLLKKAGMVVLAAGAGMVALTPAAFAGDISDASPSDSGHSSGHDHGHWGHGSGNHKTASSCDNGANQLNASKNDSLVGVLNGSQVAAPINACHILDDNNILNNLGVDVL